MHQPSAIINRGLLRYVTGDATLPHGGGHRIIMHCVNDIGKWGRGFVTALSKRWKRPEDGYRFWYRSQSGFKLGEIQMVDIQSDLAVCNMIAQHDIVATKDEDGNIVQPFREEALRSCLKKLAVEAKDRKSSVHAPRLCAGLAAGAMTGYDEATWNVVEKIIKDELIDQGINVTIYDLEEK